jgi:hypothetical protein
LGWDVAAGSAALQVAARGCMLGSVLLAGRALWRAAWQLHLDYAPTPYIGRFLCDQPLIDAQRLDLGRPAPRPPTIYSVSEPLQQAVLELQRKRGPLDEPFKGWRGVPVLCMHGPPGTGKTASAQGMAQAVGGQLAPVSAAELSIEDVVIAGPGLNCFTLLQEANQLGKKTGRPVAVFIDEVDALLPAGRSNLKTPGDLNRAINLVLLHAALSLLDDSISYIFVIFATNHVDKIQDALGLLTTRLPFLLDLPTQADMQTMLAQKLADVQQTLEKLNLPRCHMANAQAQTQELARRIVQGGLSGRDAEAAVASGLGALVAHHSRHSREDADAVFFAVLTSTIDRRLAEVGGRKPMPALSATTIQSQRGPQTLKALLRSLGILTLDPGVVISHVVKFIAAGLTDPQQSFRLSQVTGRAGRAGYQLVIQAITARATTLHQPHRDFDDVPREQVHDVLGQSAGISAHSWVNTQRRYLQDALRDARFLRGATGATASAAASPGLHPHR